jgi:ribosomal protein S18 acetylase RimI-like enzyme
MEDLTKAALRFRFAKADDRPQLIPLINSAFAVETFLEVARTDHERLAAMTETGEILLAEDVSGHLLGCLYTEIRGSRGYLGMLAVDPGHQRSGLGRQLLAEAEDRFRARGCDGIDITVLSLRPELPPIYRRFGFVETGTEPYLGSHNLKPGLECHCILMSKRL